MKPRRRPRIIRNCTDHFRKYQVDSDWEAKGLPDQPTQTVPGSQQKIEVLRARLDDGVELWHPGDRVHFPDWWPKVWGELSRNNEMLVGKAGEWQ